MKKATSGENLKDNLDALKNIVAWFDNQTEVDVEQGLEKVKLGAELVKKTKARLSEIENEFQEIQREIEKDSTEKSSPLSK